MRGFESHRGHQVSCINSICRVVIKGMLMKTLTTFLNESSQSKKVYVGNCVNSFDDDGECVVHHLPYRDTTDFAQGEENSKKINKSEFNKHVDIPSHLDKIHKSKDTVYLHDRDNNVHMMYDPKKDVHHFFV